MKFAWFDAHLDLAFLSLEGRDLMEQLQNVSHGPTPASITFPSLKQGNVRWVFGTIFTAPDMKGDFSYPRKDDVEGAYQCGLQQLQLYQLWEKLGLLKLIKSPQDLESPKTQELRSSETQDLKNSMPQDFQLLISMEGADPIRNPDEVSWWFEQGVRAVGLAWAMGTRYAGGNYRKGPLTQLGIDCIKELERLGIIHDLSHLSDQAAFSLLERTSGPVIASHSNARHWLEPENERHLTDDTIKAISQRGGMIGLNLYSRFLVKEKKKRRASIEETIQHIEHICKVMGRNDGIGLGSDMDGGFGADQLPQGINKPAHLHYLLQALIKQGWSQKELEGFTHKNWLRYLKKNLPK